MRFGYNKYFRVILLVRTHIGVKSSDFERPSISQELPRIIGRVELKNIRCSVGHTNVLLPNKMYSLLSEYIYYSRKKEISQHKIINIFQFLSKHYLNKLFFQKKKVKKQYLLMDLIHFVNFLHKNLLL